MIGEVTDSKRLVLDEEQFKLAARRKISLRQLLRLEKKKEAEQERLNEIVKQDIALIGNCTFFFEFLL